MTEIFHFAKEDWTNLTNIRGANLYYAENNTEGQWSEMIRSNKSLFSDIVAASRRSA